ncbi:hypothetical protein Tco_0732163 [Tanacetum coccineum]
MHYPVLTDYIGCVRSVGDINNPGDPNRSQSLRRKIDVQNLKYKAMYQATPPLAIRKAPYEDAAQEKLRNRYPLKPIMEHNPDTYRIAKEGYAIQANTDVQDLDYFNRCLELNNSYRIP